MSLRKRFISNSLYNLASYFLLIAFSLISIPLILHGLGRDLFGVYVLFSTVIPIISIFDLGVGTALIRQLSHPNITPEDRDKFWNAGFAFFFWSALVISLVSGLAVYLIKTTVFKDLSLAPLVLNLSIISIALTAFFNHVNGYLYVIPQAQQRFHIYNVRTLLIGSFNTLISALVAKYTHDLSFVLLVQLIGFILSFIYLYFSQKIRLSFISLIRVPLKEISQLLHFGLRTFLGTAANQVEANFSKYVIGLTASPLAITAFSIPQGVVYKGAGVASQIGLSLFPTGTSLLTKDKLHKLTKLILSVEGAVLLFDFAAIFAAFFFGEPFLTWWLKDPQIVALAVPSLKILSLYMLLISLTPVTTVILTSLGHPQIPSFFAILTAAINVILLFILVPTYQALGAAYASLFSALVTVPSILIVFGYIYRKESRKIRFPSETSPLPPLA